MKNSIQNKISRQFSFLLTSLLIFIIASISFLFISNIKENAQTLFQNKAILIQNKIEDRIEYLIDMTNLLSKNSLMINALIDEEGKEKYLTPLASNFMEDKSVKHLNIVDFDGKVVFKTSENVPTYQDSKHLRRALTFAKTIYFINASNELTIISPIKYYSTTQGALISTFSLSNIIDKYTIVTSSEYLTIKFKDSNIYSKNYTDASTYYSYELTPLRNSIFEKLNLKVQIGEWQSIYLAPVKDAIIKLIIISLVLLVLGLIISRHLVKKITHPILKLYKNVQKGTFQKEYIPLGTDDELEELSQAFYKKTHELYQLQEEEITKQKILSQQSKMASMGEMIANIAHQWRQPLSVISTAATGMRMKEEFNMPIEKEERLNTYDMINKNAQFLSRTIDDFKNFLKGERTRKLFNLTEELKSVINLVEGSIKSNDINVVFDLNDDIKLDGFPNELAQCVINIFNNAKDAFNDNKIGKRYFFITTQVDDNSFVIQFKDNAGGIPEHIISKIFDPYFTTKNASQGTGLGLSMTYKLITEGMHGSLEVRNSKYNYNNEEYVGAIFEIKLPVLTK